jgi:hypothetical protein
VRIAALEERWAPVVPIEDCYARGSRYALEERPENLRDLRQQTGKAIRIEQREWRIRLRKPAMARQVADRERAKNRKDDTLGFLH